MVFVCIPDIGPPLMSHAAAIMLQVYAWFLRTHQVSVAVGGVGYLLLLLELFGVGPILRFLYPATLSIMMVWYGLYFGILGRDCAEVAADRMVRCCLHSSTVQTNL